MNHPFNTTAQEPAKKSQNLDYEEWYHAQRHSTHFNDDYYNARAKIALTKFFDGVDKDLRVLDFGCGLGQNILYMPNAMGYDISKFGIEFCRRKGIKATNEVDEVPNAAFDIVLSTHVLEHHPHPKTMLEQIYSKLKPGGKLILVIPYERHGKARFELDLNQHLYMWNFQTINNLLLVNGFKIEKNKYVHGAGYNRLLPLAKKNFGLYRFATNLLSKLAGIREIMVVATKPKA
jgi:SAM-dependent methyltransferase